MRDMTIKELMSNKTTSELHMLKVLREEVSRFQKQNSVRVKKVSVILSEPDGNRKDVSDIIMHLDMDFLEALQYVPKGEVDAPGQIMMFGEH